METPCYGIIPARFASTRFPGKPLADIAGKPMIWHVYQRARQCRLLHSVTVATDDPRICLVADELGMDCVMTSPDHPSGTDRVHEAARILRAEAEAIIVNIQGDEPLLDPFMVETLLSAFGSPDVQASTLAVPLDAEAARSPNQVKVVTDVTGNALYFSRAVIPHQRDAGAPVTYLGHIGLYAYRMSALTRFVSLPPSRLECIERLEQLRLLENGLSLKVLTVPEHRPGVDTPEDLERILPFFTKTLPAGSSA